MASPEYARVLEHVGALYEGRFTKDDDVASIVRKNRELLAEYANVGGTKPPLRPDTRITPVQARGVPAEWVLASEADPDRRLLWIHGGACVAGSPRDYRTVTEMLSQTAGASVLAVDYRLAPECPFPAGLDDCLAVYRWLRGHGPDGRKAAQAILIAGDSAGGNLALATMLSLKQRGEPPPNAAATIGASTDMTASGESMRTLAHVDPMISREVVRFVARLYVQDDTPLTDPLVSPLFGELAGLPPLLMHVGERETLRDDTLRFFERARAAQVTVEAKVWPEMVHVFELFCHVLPEARASLQEIGDFLRRHS